MAAEVRNFKKVLITGISGSGGSYLADHILAADQNVEVHGVSRWHSTTTTNNLTAQQRLHVHECDLTDLSSVMRVLKKVKPDAIFNLASHANVRACFDTPLAVLQNNIMSTANLFEAVRILELDAIIQHCSTSEVYGKVEAKYIPIKEDCPISPVSPYAVSKATQDLLGYSYFLNFGLKIMRTRMFSYVNPRRRDLFATSFAMQVARIEVGLQKELLHGNLDSVRTMIDARDAMDCYWTALKMCRPGEVYNMGGSTQLTVGKFLEILKSKATCDIPSRVDPSLLRPTDVTLQIPDTSKFTQETGWKEKYTFEQSVQFLLDYCRLQAKKELHMQKA